MGQDSKEQKAKPVHHIMVRWLYWVANVRGEAMDRWLKITQELSPATRQTLKEIESRFKQARETWQKKRSSQ